MRDCVIIGGGIAGLAAAADLERAGLDFVLLEAGTSYSDSRTGSVGCASCAAHLGGRLSAKVVELGRSYRAFCVCAAFAQ